MSTVISRYYVRASLVGVNGAICSTLPSNMSSNEGLLGRAQLCVPVARLIHIH